MGIDRVAAVARAAIASNSTCTRPDGHTAAAGAGRGAGREAAAARAFCRDGLRAALPTRVGS
jgi:hypothetical protein